MKKDSLVKILLKKIPAKKDGNNQSSNPNHNNNLNHNNHLNNRSLSRDLQNLKDHNILLERIPQKGS